MDHLVYGFSKSKEISFTFANVTDAVKKLEQMHLSGPTAGKFLAETLAAVAILSIDLGDKDERISIQTKVDGPLGGSFADASKEGNLRGYTTKKILNEFDGDASTKLSAVLGSSGEFTFIKSNSRMVLAQNRVRCNPLDMRHGLARYYNDIQNQPTGIEIIAENENFTINKALALKITRTAEGTSEDFVPLLEKLNDGTIKNLLLKGVEDLKELGKALNIEDLEILEHRALQAKCTCSKEKVLYSISCLANEELNDILRRKEIPEVTCHFCSTTYHVSTEEVANILRNRK
jgi:molecular chaperone Hsp33